MEIPAAVALAFVDQASYPARQCGRAHPMRTAEHSHSCCCSCCLLTHPTAPDAFPDLVFVAFSGFASSEPAPGWVGTRRGPPRSWGRRRRAAHGIGALGGVSLGRLQLVRGSGSRDPGLALGMGHFLKERLRGWRQYSDTALQALSRSDKQLRAVTGTGSNEIWLPAEAAAVLCARWRPGSLNSTVAPRSPTRSERGCRTGGR